MFGRPSFKVHFNEKKGSENVICVHPLLVEWGVDGDIINYGWIVIVM